MLRCPCSHDFAFIFSLILKCHFRNAESLRWWTPCPGLKPMFSVFPCWRVSVVEMKARWSSWPAGKEEESGGQLTWRASAWSTATTSLPPHPFPSRQVSPSADDIRPGIITLLSYPGGCQALDGAVQSTFSPGEISVKYNIFVNLYFFLKLTRLHCS